MIDNPSENVQMVQAIPLSVCVPDPFQARIILPPEIKNAFYGGRIDCYQAAGSMLAATEYEPALQSQIQSLLSLGQNITEVGQIEPATGRWIIDKQGNRSFALEVGERRFWALAFIAVNLGLDEEPQIKVIEHSNPSRARQVAENIHREGNTAVDLARAIATLLLLHIGVEPDPAVENDYDYFRRVFEVPRFPNGTWEMMRSKVKLSRQAMLRHINILRLPDELLYLGKLHALPEGRLREILAAPPARQHELMRFATQDNLSARELKEKGGHMNPPLHAKAAAQLQEYVIAAKAGADPVAFEQIARTYLSQTRTPEELIKTAEHLEKQAVWLRKVYESQ